LIIKNKIGDPKLKKTKLKAKGKKYYKNTHGTVYRVKPKVNKRVLLKKRQAKLDQVKVA
jgi:hypothetical protein